MKVFANGSHQVIWGDVISALNEYVDDESVDLIFADPPYNIGKNFNSTMDRWATDEEYLNWCYQWIDLCVKKLKPTGCFYVMTATQNMPYFDLHLRKQMHVLSRIVWAYDSSGVQARKYFGSLYEPILYCVRDKDNYTFNADEILVEAKTGATRKLIDHRKPVPQVYSSKKVPGNVWYIPRVRYRMEEYENHPTQKPVALLNRIIKASTNPGDTVLDPFSGTFTTSYVAKMLERKSIGIELDESFMKIGLRRLTVQSSYNGELLVKELKSFEIKSQLDHEKQKSRFATSHSVMHVGGKT